MTVNKVDMVSYRSLKSQSVLNLVNKSVTQNLKKETSELPEKIKTIETLVKDTFSSNSGQQEIKFVGRLQTLDEFMKDFFNKK